MAIDAAVDNTGSTLSAQTSTPVKRRLARVQVVNIEQPLDIYELACRSSEYLESRDWQTLATPYEEALTTLENQNIGSARELATQLAADFPNDRATAALLYRIDPAQQADGENTTDTSI